MIFNCFEHGEFRLHETSRFMPGDVILTGTPAGIGPIQSRRSAWRCGSQGLTPLINTVK
jgi:2-keto-4-pentenoate hydratase/2-oxohepta-3-ene-1,7-dioic acid hydratase in catechol pathway